MSLKTDLKRLKDAGAIITQQPGEPIQTFALNCVISANYLEAALRRTIERNNRVIEAQNTYRPYPRPTRPARWVKGRRRQGK